MQSGIKTVFLTQMNTFNNFGIPLTPLPNTSISNKFGLITNEENTEMHKISCWTIGKRPDALKDDILINRHKGIDGSLYEHIPFIIRPVGQNFPSIVNNYCLKTNINIDGNNYIAYYGKKIKNIRHESKLVGIDLNRLEEKLFEYDENNTQILNPIPSTNETDILDNNKYVGVSAKIILDMNSEEIYEFKNSCTILGIEPKIYEIGLVAGVEKDNDLYYGIMTHIIMEPMDLTNADIINKIYDIGGLDPLTR